MCKLTTDRDHKLYHQSNMYAMYAMHVNSSALLCNRLAHAAIDLLLLCPGRSAEYCHQAVCPSVCLSVREHIAGTAGPIFTKFVV